MADVDWASIIASWGGQTALTMVGSIIMLNLKRRVDKSIENIKSDLQQNVVKFTKWHEKRILALEEIYIAFQAYLDFLRLKLYFDCDVSLDPMHDFRKSLDKQKLYLDDSMERKISQYEGELLMFWSASIQSLAIEGESAREEIRHELDYKIPSYLVKLREDINSYLDPNHEFGKESFRLFIADAMASANVDKGDEQE